MIAATVTAFATLLPPLIRKYAVADFLCFDVCATCQSPSPRRLITLDYMPCQAAAFRQNTYSPIEQHIHIITKHIDKMLLRYAYDYTTLLRKDARARCCSQRESAPRALFYALPRLSDAIMLALSSRLLYFFYADFSPPCRRYAAAIFISPFVILSAIRQPRRYFHVCRQFRDAVTVTLHMLTPILPRLLFDTMPPLPCCQRLRHCFAITDIC